MFDLVIKPTKTEEAKPCCEPIPEKPRYPKLCLNGTSKDALIKALGSTPDLDEELILDGVKVRVCGLTHNEWTNEIELNVLSLESATSSGESDDDDKPSKDDAMNRAVGRRGKMNPED